MTWGHEEPVVERRRSLRRDPPARAAPARPAESDDLLKVRIGEELDYVRRMLDALGDNLSSDPILIRRHAVSLQSLDIVSQILTHVGNVIRSSDPHSAVQTVSMGDLRARLMRRNSL